MKKTLEEDGSFMWLGLLVRSLVEVFLMFSLWTAWSSFLVPLLLTSPAHQFFLRLSNSPHLSPHFSCYRALLVLSIADSLLHCSIKEDM